MRTSVAPESVGEAATARSSFCLYNVSVKLRASLARPWLQPTDRLYPSSRIRPRAAPPACQLPGVCQGRPSASTDCYTPVSILEPDYCVYARGRQLGGLQHEIGAAGGKSNFNLRLATLHWRDSHDLKTPERGSVLNHRSSSSVQSYRDLILVVGRGAKDLLLLTGNRATGLKQRREDATERL